MKQEEEGNMITDWLEKNGNPEIMKQVEKEAEELELQHYAEKRYPFEGGFQVMDIDISEMLQLAFISGAKWQKSRMYTEEDMRLAFEVGRNFQLTGENNFNEILKK